MSNEMEVIIAIGVCLSVFTISIGGVVIYTLMELGRQQREQRSQNFKIQVLVDSIIEIFDSNNKHYGESEDDKTGISPGG